jgi:hypothetical protein
MNSVNSAELGLGNLCCILRYSSKVSVRVMVVVVVLCQLKIYLIQ